MLDVVWVSDECSYTTYVWLQQNLLLCLLGLYSELFSTQLFQLVVFLRIFFCLSKQPHTKNQKHSHVSVLLCLSVNFHIYSLHRNFAKWVEVRQVEVACCGCGLEYLDRKCIWTLQTSSEMDSFAYRANRNQSHVVSASACLNKFKSFPKGLIQQGFNGRVSDWQWFLFNWRTEELLFDSEFQKQQHLATGFYPDDQLAKGNTPRNRTSKSMDLGECTHIHTQTHTPFPVHQLLNGHQHTNHLLVPIITTVHV